MVTILEITRDLTLAYLAKYPLATSSYSANMEASMQKLREETLSFMKEVYYELRRLEDSQPPLPPPVE